MSRIFEICISQIFDEKYGAFGFWWMFTGLKWGFCFCDVSPSPGSVKLINDR